MAASGRKVRSRGCDGVVLYSMGAVVTETRRIAVKVTTISHGPSRLFVLGDVTSPDLGWSAISTEDYLLPSCPEIRLSSSALALQLPERRLKHGRSITNRAEAAHSGHWR